MLYEAQGRQAQAVPLSKLALSIREKALGPSHRETISNMNDLARLYRATKQTSAAMELERRALSMRLDRFRQRGHAHESASLPENQPAP